MADINRKSGPQFFESTWGTCSYNYNACAFQYFDSYFFVNTSDMLFLIEILDGLVLSALEIWRNRKVLVKYDSRHVICINSSFEVCMYLREVSLIMNLSELNTTLAVPKKDQTSLIKLCRLRNVFSIAVVDSRIMF